MNLQPSLGVETIIASMPLALGLAVSLFVAGLYPIHITFRIKVYVTTIPTYLAVILLPPPIAALTLGLTTLITEVRAMAKKGNYPSDVATAVGRWVLVTALAGIFAHLVPTNRMEQILLLLGTAVAMYLGDVVTCAFEVAPMSGEPPWRVMMTLLREGTIVEGVQYLLAILGAIAALQEIWSLILLALPTVIVYFAFKNAKEMQDSTSKLLENMADAVDLRDPYTGGHSRRVADLTSKVLHALDASGPEATLIVAAARVHDIGKIGIPDALLKKQEALSLEEWTVMESHTNHGAELLARYPDFSRGMDFVRSHHERWDGKGYPRHLKGLDIPFGARVIAVVDAFDAMTSDRPYRQALTVEQAAQNLLAGRGKQWDPKIVDALIRTLSKQLGRSDIAGPLPLAGFAPAAE
ncbi:MAG: HD-GYP domain-containing protein [Chloroflexi bacterium]|nr:HD-GYP domain-containing protein [Chloroflexota bacterium]